MQMTEHRAGAISELRHDPVLDKWVIISPARGKRPTDFKSHPKPQQSQGPCAFCLHHEHECAPELFRIPEGTWDWRVRVIKNLYPALSMDPDSGMEFADKTSDSEGLHSLHYSLNGFGSHDVVVETPDHSTPLASLPASRIHDILLAYKKRVQQLSSNEHIKYVQVFKNHGDSAGASMRHSHSQIIALPMVPINAARRLSNAKEYFTRTQKCNLCEFLSHGIQSGSLLIDESPHFISFVPYAASYPFETWIAPREHASHYEGIDDEKGAISVHLYTSIIFYTHSYRL
eukprot:Gb_04070 [translate_table: standard]